MIFYKSKSFERGDRVRLTSVPKCMPEDLGKCGIIQYFSSSLGGSVEAHLILDGEDGLTVCFEEQLEAV